MLLLLADHPIALVRRPAYDRTENGERPAEAHVTRVVSLNCSTGDVRAADEVASFKPDIVLLQESPGREQLVQLAQQWYGDDGAVIWGRDASIIARGQLVPIELPKAVAPNATCARARLASGAQLTVVCLRLAPAIVRLDLWSLDCWRQQMANHRLRRSQLAAIVRSARPSDGLPLLIGGDFNAPAGDSVFDVLRPALHDAFAEAGRGWGNTIVNNWPFHRIDQVWLSTDLTASQVFAVRTDRSDHRMVVCDCATVR
ncbi:MAG TPA: endonuclease/exonuclease/phosphatase family protein [Pirellulales bacterium]|nr:endonuclease/exonuclease/phosphatase family protein [Pirellulales bacterium]